jgi:PPIC-type peptidyl-prolyl cis-trans isomerase-like protein
MRRVGWAVLMAGSTLTGCSSFRDVFTSHAETAARVGSHQLKSAYVADIISRVGGANANPQAAEAVTNIWVDIALFGDRVGRGELKPDSTFLERLLWPQLAQSKSAAWHDSIVARRPPVSPSVADSAFTKGDIRLFQHVLILPKGTTPADTAKAKAEAERLVPLAKADFGKTATDHSADPGNKGDKGYLPPSPKGMFDPTFEATAWTLEPGQISGVVRTQFGFHIIRRPPLAEIRDRFAVQLTQLHSQAADSVYFAELAAKNKIEVKSGAVAAVRSALSDLAAARKSRKELVTFRDGAFTVADFARWMGAIPGAQLGQIKEANDSLITAFLRNLAQNTVLLREADSAKIPVSPEVYRGLAAQYTTLVNDLKQAIGLDGAEFSDSSKTPTAERVKLAEQKVDAYFDKLTKGQAQFRQVPPTLSSELRSQGDFKVYQAGIARAVELILAKRRTDSASGNTAPPAPAPGTLQPAPGGPPTPGKTP